MSPGASLDEVYAELTNSLRPISALSQLKTDSLQLLSMYRTGRKNPKCGRTRH